MCSICGVACRGLNICVDKLGKLGKTGKRKMGSLQIYGEEKLPRIPAPFPHKAPFYRIHPIRLQERSTESGIWDPARKLYWDETPIFMVSKFSLKPNVCIDSSCCRPIQRIPDTGSGDLPSREVGISFHLPEATCNARGQIKMARQSFPSSVTALPTRKKKGYYISISRVCFKYGIFQKIFLEMVFYGLRENEINAGKS